MFTNRSTNKWKKYRYVQRSVRRHLSDIKRSEVLGDLLETSFCNEPNQSTEEILSERTNVQIQHDTSLFTNEPSFSSTSNSSQPDLFSDLLASYTGSSSDSTLRMKLALWAINHRIRHRALTDLLHILREYHTLPGDSRTLLKTKNNFSIRSMNDACDNNGQYVYFGLKQKLHDFVNSASLAKWSGNTIELLHNIDGLPLFKSSGKQFWPILCAANVSGLTSKPFLVAVFCGSSKPSSVDEFLNDFVTELSDLHSRGLTISNTHFRVRTKAFVCDAPARSFIKCIKSHNAYYGCERCEQRGRRIDKRILFREFNSTRRTDESFAMHSQIEHHKGISPLSRLDVGLVSGVPLEYMHLMCLGAARRILVSLTKGERKVRLSRYNINKISDCMKKAGKFICCEFQRKPRHLNELDRWKAVEFRQFMLYIGPVALRGNVMSEVYHHFMLLHVAMTILLTREMCTEYCDYADDLLNKFVRELKSVYNESSMVYTMHSLTHICDDVRRLGSLDGYSAFPFENALGVIKRMLRSGNLPLSQLCRRLSEIEAHSDTIQHSSIQDVHPEFSHLHMQGPTLGLSGEMYRSVSYKGLSFSIGRCADSFGMDEYDKVLKILNIIKTENSTVAIVKFFKDQDNFYTYPCKSNELKIYRVTQICENYSAVPLSSIKRKCLLLPYKDFFVSFPIINLSS